MRPQAVARRFLVCVLPVFACNRKNAFFVHHQGGEILAKPVGKFVHIGVYAQSYSCFYRLKRNIAFILHSNFHGGLSFPFFIGEAAFHSLYGGAERTVAVRNPCGAEVTVAHIGIEGRTGVALFQKERNGVVVAVTFEYKLFQGTFGRDASFPVTVFPKRGLCRQAAPA